MFNNGFNINHSGIGQMGMGQMGMNPPMAPMGINPSMAPMGMNPPMAPMGINPPMAPMGVNPQMQINTQNGLMSRLKQEYDLCVQDNDLIQIGCNFGLDNNNIYIWRVTMIGPGGTPYEKGLFTIKVIFPQDYPNHGAEFKFMNKIYHLNVDCKNDFGHICINSLNDWRIRGQVKDLPFFTIKQALFDIFCLFYNQGVDSAYDQEMADLYKNNPDQFNAIARQWTSMYAIPL